MAKIAPVGRTLTESPDPLAIRKRSRSSRRGVVRISIDESNIVPPTARDLSYIGLAAESGKALHLTPIVPVSLILTGRNPDVEIVRRRKSPCFIRRRMPREDGRGRELRY